MLRRLRIRNFKAWQDTRQVELAPLTVIFGANSSGKSSINHFLMMLKQTVRSPDKNSVFDFGDASAAVRLGSFKDLVFAHDAGRSLRFESEWSLPTTLTVRDPKTGRRYSGDRLAFSASARLPEGRSRVVQSEGFEYDLLQKNEKQLSVRMHRDKDRPNRWGLEADRYELVRTTGRAWELPKPVQFYGFPDQAAVYFQNTAFLSELELALESRLQGISYLGPLRVPPERLYSWAGSIPEDVGWQGSNAVQAILAAADRRFNWRPRERTVPFERVVGRWLLEMGLIDSFDVAEIAPDRNEFEVRVRAGSVSDEVKLTDVGFGVSQVLPVIVQSFYAPPNSTVLMEQPEIHLHPGVQAKLADLFISAVTAREDGTARNVQLLVESHSEHLLQRLQRRVAEQRIAPEDVALFFAYPGPGGATLERLELDAYGEILNWPPDFFGDELGDLAVQAKVGMQRKLALRNA